MTRRSGILWNGKFYAQNWKAKLLKMTSVIGKQPKKLSTLVNNSVMLELD